MIYLIGDSYIGSNEIMNKAIEISLKELMDKGEITKSADKRAVDGINMPIAALFAYVYFG